MTSSPTWYDLLAVEPTASADEIRAAWRAAVADLDPTDRRFQRLSEAAGVLLDPERRAEYDASLAEDSVGEDDEEDGEESVGRAASAGERVETPAADGEPEPRAPGRTVPLGVLAALGALALVLVALAAFSWSRPDPQAIEGDADGARTAAERAVVHVLSYDYRTLDQDEREASSYLTSRYRDAKYTSVFGVIKKNAPDTQTVVTTSVVESGVVRASEDRVEVLLLVDRPTTNKVQRTPIPYEDQVTVTMQKTDGRWLVDDMVT